MSAVEERFGPYGGRYVPETLIPALDELTAAWAAAREDEEFQRRLPSCTATSSAARRRSTAPTASPSGPGARVYLKREDLAHTGAHKINNAIGQALLAQRMGKPRVIAETGAGQHGVATATACALLGLECVVYMGTEDIRRQTPNVERMGLLGAEVVPVEAGARTLKEAVSAAIRDWVANVETTHYVIGSAVGPAPFPALVRDLQRVIGDEAREQALAAEGAPAGAGDRLRRRRLQLDRHLHPVHRRRGGRADRRRGRGGGARERPPRRLAAGRAAPASCTARSPRCSPTRRGRSSRRTRSRPASTTRASAPSTPTCATPAAPATSRSPTSRRSPPSRELSRLEGIIPALESAHAIAWLLENGGGEGYDVLCLSGRGDKDLAEVWSGPGVTASDAWRPRGTSDLRRGRWSGAAG